MIFLDNAMNSKCILSVIFITIAGVDTQYYVIIFQCGTIPMTYHNNIRFYIYLYIYCHHIFSFIMENCTVIKIT